MNNFTAENFIDSIRPIFKELTGLDLDNHTDEEFQEWYHKEMQREAETDPYIREILRSVERIIEGKDYSQLTAIMKNYDTLVKEKLSNYDKKLPYWCYCFGMQPKED